LSNLPVIAITAGEPAGVGAELIAKISRDSFPACLAIIADRDLIARAAKFCQLEIELKPFDGSPHQPGSLQVVPISCPTETTPGVLSTESARYVLNTLDNALDGCVSKRYSAMVTGPVQKSVINDAGIPFSGHTEYLADRSNAALPVMMLANKSLRVALYSTHLPLRAVADSLNEDRLEQVIRILHTDLGNRFGLNDPRIAVCGLNPHAGESGHLGDEEINIINPVLKRLRNQGMKLLGALPADTAFTQESLQHCDCVLAMYHDQGLPVIKHAGFGEVVNITLGLPIIRTSVDHGTALDLAGSGKASEASLQTAIELAIEMSSSQN
jgi:4-hydroxythreonine-4-phosphate dehydrogenase